MDAAILQRCSVHGDPVKCPSRLSSRESYFSCISTLNIGTETAGSCELVMSTTKLPSARVRSLQAYRLPLGRLVHSPDFLWLDNDCGELSLSWILLFKKNELTLPMAKCQPIWQCSPQIPGSSVINLNIAHDAPGTISVSRLKGFVVCSSRFGTSTSVMLPLPRPTR
jgi:hypothetical protein